MKYGCCLFHLLTLTPLVKHLPLANAIAGKKRRKTTEINLAAPLVEHTDTQATDTDVNTRKFTLSSHEHANKHIITIDKQKYTHKHALRWGKTMHTSAGQCLPEDRREL